MIGASKGRTSRLDGQPDLFSGSEPDRMADAVEPAADSSDLLDLGTRLPRGLYLGTSSWAFPTWAGLVYRRHVDAALLARAGLAAYARHPLLTAVGIDRTFYAPLPVEAYAGYAAQVPEHFRFLVKAPLMCTTPYLHAGGGQRPGSNPRFLDGGYAAEAFVAPCQAGLRGKAGVLVFQFPPLGRAVTAAPARFAARLTRFLEALPRGPIYAVEVRDRALLGHDLLRALADGGARLCLGVHPRMPDAVAQGKLAAALPRGPLVVRWNLRAGWTYEQARVRFHPFDRLVDEDPATRAALVDLCRRALTDGQPAFVIANNKAEGSAPLTLVKLAAAIAPPR